MRGSQSDQLSNLHFRMRWRGPPLERSGPRIVPTIQRPEFEDGSRGPEHTVGLSVLQEAFCLDRLADAELSVGHVAQAERLAHAAAELREASR
jgi:hypothetical protein